MYIQSLSHLVIDHNHIYYVSSTYNQLQVFNQVVVPVISNKWKECTVLCCAKLDMNATD